MFCKEIRCACNSKYNLNFENKVILLMIADSEYMDNWEIFDETSLLDKEFFL